MHVNDVISTQIHSLPTEVIIHAGTNSLITYSSKEFFANIQQLSSRIRREFKEAKIAISSLITRKDYNVTSKTQ